MKKKNTKKSSKAQKALALSRRQTVFGILILFIVIGAIYVFSGFAHQAFYVKPREARIKEIYQSLNLSDDYIVQRTAISGEKRLYPHDKSRSYSSYIEYLRGADLETTATELDARIKAAGFTFFDEPYPGMRGSLQYHYRSQDAEYIRLSVESKPRKDAFQNFVLMNPDEDLPLSLFELDPNAGPTEVTIKVNLDDNNE